MQHDDITPQPPSERGRMSPLGVLAWVGVVAATVALLVSGIVGMLLKG